MAGNSHIAHGQACIDGEACIRLPFKVAPEMVCAAMIAAGLTIGRWNK